MNTEKSKLNEVISRFSRVGAQLAGRTAHSVERRVQQTVAQADQARAVANVPGSTSQAVDAVVSAAIAHPAPSDAMVPGVRQQISPTGGRTDVLIKRAVVLPSPPANAALASAHAYAASLGESRMVGRPGERQVVQKSGAGQRTMVSPLGSKSHVVRATSQSGKK